MSCLNHEASVSAKSRFLGASRIDPAGEATSVGCDCKTATEPMDLVDRQGLKQAPKVQCGLATAPEPISLVNTQDSRCTVWKNALPEDAAWHWSSGHIQGECRCDDASWCMCPVYICLSACVPLSVCLSSFLRVYACSCICVAQRTFILATEQV